ncbi:MULTISPECIES: helix-turn-helix domain-containing protein [Burkholderia]|nr:MULTISPECIES: helix-turn-helix domain-containing protein [Burkholderia]
MRTSDVHQHADSIHDWSQEYDQLSRGRFAGSLREIWSDAPRTQVFHEYTEQLTFQQCMPWRGSIWIGIPDHGAYRDLGFCGHDMTDAAPMLMNATDNEMFSLSTPKKFGIYGVLIEQSEWMLRRERLGLNPMHRSALHATAMSVETHRELTALIEAILRTGDEGTPPEHAMLDGMLDQLLDMLCIVCDGDSAFQKDRRFRDRLNVVIRARALVLDDCDSVDEAVRLERLCDHLHVTRRTLQNYCTSVVGKSPAHFLKAVRLSACRRALLAAEPLSVQDVAWRWGFRHLGHFSQDYKLMFEELPSSTRKDGLVSRIAMLSGEVASLLCQR